MKKKVVSILSVLLAGIMLFSVGASAAGQQDVAAAQWGSYRGSANNNGITNAKTPTDQAGTSLDWAYQVKESTDWATNISDPLIIGEKIYIIAGDELRILDTQGKETAKTQLADSIDFISRAIYHQGTIVIPLSGGKLQAIDIDTLESVWVTDEVVLYGKEGNRQEQQSITTLTQDKGKVYMGTAYADWQTSYSGVYMCVDILTGEKVWEVVNDQAGYYWSGAVCTDTAVIFGGDDGILRSLTKETGKEIAALSLESGIRSTMVLDENTVYFSTVNGSLHQVEVHADGTFGTAKSVSFANSSTGTPAVYNGKVYVGGALGKEDQYQGVLAVIDAKTMSITQKVRTLADVKSAPLVSAGHENTVYVYYTCNITPGGVFALTEKNNVINESQELFTPQGDGQNYCMASVIAGEDGTIYYTNDSGKLFALKSRSGVMLGDINGDSLVDLKDVLMVQKHVAKSITLTDAQFEAADVDKSGAVDMNDVILIQKHIAKYINLEDM